MCHTLEKAAILGASIECLPFPPPRPIHKVNMYCSRQRLNRHPYLSVHRTQNQRSGSDDAVGQRLAGGFTTTRARRTYQAGQNEPVICFVLDPLESAADKSQGDSDGGEGQACCIRSNHVWHSVVTDVVLLITDLSRREHSSHGVRVDLPSSCCRIVVGHQVRHHEDGVIVSQPA